MDKNELLLMSVDRKMSCSEIAKIKGVGRSTVLKYLNRYGIPKLSAGGRVKYEANHQCFNRWSSHMAYCVGFIAADGHVWKIRPFITIAINTTDIEILEYIRNYMSPKSLIRPTRKKSQICIRSEQIHKKLVNLGIDNNKTFCLSMPKMPSRYIPDFIRGFFDGDGSIWKMNRGTYRSNFISASPHILTDIYNFLGFGRLRVTKKGYYTLSFSQSETIRLQKTIYYKSSVFKLRRKYDKFILAQDRSIETYVQKWTKEEDYIILEYMEKWDIGVLQKLILNRTSQAIKSRRNRLRKLWNEATKNN